MGERKKWLLTPGWVRSRNDNDEHYIGAARLARLYGVSLSECIVICEEFARTGYGLTARQRSLPVLRPRYDGDYTLPAAPGKEEG